jgi:hypothetical protein
LTNNELVLGPIALGHAEASVLRKHIETNFEPDIDSKARAMANKIDRYLPFFVSSLTAHWVGLNAIEGVQFIKPAEASEGGSQPSVRTDWHIEWKHQLFLAFQTALRFRARIEKTGHSETKFEFPAFMTAFDRGWPGLMKMYPSPTDNDPDARIMCSLLPRVKRRVKKWIVDKLDEMPWHTLYEGMVLVGVPAVKDPPRPGSET